MAFRHWDGTEWQDYCIALLRRRYSNHMLQEVPDRHNGDLGIEAFAHDGCAFQCYAAEEPLGVDALYKAQRDKLTVDLGKLKKNQAALAKLLGAVVIDTYVFMVHRNASRLLVEHASTKAAEVRDWGLAFVADDFKVVVVTDDYYAVERGDLYAIPEQLVNPVPATAQELAAWTLKNSGLMANVHRKLSCVGITGAALDSYKESISSAYLEGENALQQLKEKAPENWLAALDAKSRRERRLAMMYPAQSNTDSKIVPMAVDELAAEIQRDSPAISKTLSEAIAWGAVADWLMRCPLDMGDQA